MNINYADSLDCLVTSSIPSSTSVSTVTAEDLDSLLSALVNFPLQMLYMQLSFVSQDACQQDLGHHLLISRLLLHLQYSLPQLCLNQNNIRMHYHSHQIEHQAKIFQKVRSSKNS